jgi:hypothetical protein
VRGGRLNDSTYGQRMTGQGIYAELIARRFELAKKRIGFTGHGQSLRAGWQKLDRIWARAKVWYRPKNG